MGDSGGDGGQRGEWEDLGGHQDGRTRDLIS